MKRVICGLCALAGFASAASAQMYSEGVSGDLPNLPFATPSFFMAPGVNYVALGIVPTAQVDIDFISVKVPFACNTLLFDLDHLNSPLEDGVLGAGPINNFPNPLLVNDDDNNVFLDTICGHAVTAKDCLIDVGAILGVSPIPAGQYTIAIGRTGEQFGGWTGSADMQQKLEYQLYVYADPVPAPGVGALMGAVGLVGLRRRRR